MKKFSRYGALLILLASFSAPILASAQNSGGCSSAGSSCTINTVNDGTCSQNTESGDFYCRPNIFDLTSGYQTCINNGGDPAICRCEANGGVWNLTDRVCSLGGTQTLPTPSGGGINPTTSVAPQTTSGGGGININVIKPYSDSIIGIINSIFVPVLIAIAFIVFLWGVFKYFILGAANESDKAEGRKFAMWGIIGFVIILSVWGLVNILMDALNLKGGNTPPFPKI